MYYFYSNYFYSSGIEIRSDTFDGVAPPSPPISQHNSLQEKPPISEMKERMSDLHKKSDFQRKEVHKFMLDQDAFKQVDWKKYVYLLFYYLSYISSTLCALLQITRLIICLFLECCEISNVIQGSGGGYN